MCLSKKFGVKNNLGKKIFMVEKFLSPKILVEQNFESKETLDPKRFLVQKDSGPKKITLALLVRGRGLNNICHLLHVCFPQT